MTMRYPKQPKIVLMALLLVCVWLTTACEVDRYNALTEKSKDARAKDERVYGVKGQKPRQMANQYPDPADGQTRADAIRDKFYGKAEAAPAPVAKDSTDAKGKEAKEPKKEGDEKKEEKK